MALPEGVVVSRPCWCKNRSMPSACSSDRKPIRSCQASAQPINAPSHYHVEFAARSRFAERIEGRPAIAALRAANAVVLVSFDDLAAHVAGNLAQLTFLVGRGLIDGRDPQIENSAFHRKKALVFDAGTIAHLRVKKHQIFDAEMASA